MFSSELLPIYLNDHLAGAVGGTELARRAASSNEGSEYGEFLSGLADEIEADKRQLETIMDRLDVKQDKLKQRAAWMAEKAGRLKTNGRLTSYSPLSRLIELEGLAIGVNGKLRLWRSLAATAPSDPRLAEFDFVQLIERAEAQIAGLDEHHVRAAEDAFVKVEA